MAEVKSFPMMPPRHWFGLRDRFKKSVPSEVTTTYLASALSMEQDSARKNVLPGLRQTGVVGADNKPTELAYEWRDDSHYKKVCETILKSVYPTELLDLAPPESANSSEVKRWFASKAKVGDNAAGKMTAFYMMLCAGQPHPVSPANDRAARAVSARPAVPKKKAQAVRPPVVKVTGNGVHDTHHDTHKEKPQRTLVGPSVTFNFQIVISPDTTPELVDKVFESMGRHLKDF